MLAVLRFIDRVVDTALVIFFLLLLFIGGYTLYDTLKIYNDADGEDLRTYRPIISEDTDDGWGSLISEDVVAWLTVDDTNIDYPVMQGDDNNEYLNKNPFGNYSLSGSIFLDSRNASDFSDEYSLIYGHHMEYGHMFGALDDFLREKYFDAHRTGTLVVGNEIYELKIFACLECESSTQEIFRPDSYDDAMNYTREHATIWNEPEEGRLVALSTCKYPETTERIIVLGVIR